MLQWENHSIAISWAAEACKTPKWHFSYCTEFHQVLFCYFDPQSSPFILNMGIQRVTKLKLQSFLLLHVHLSTEQHWNYPSRCHSAALFWPPVHDPISLVRMSKEWNYLWHWKNCMPWILILRIAVVWVWPDDLFVIWRVGDLQHLNLSTAKGCIG